MDPSPPPVLADSSSEGLVPDAPPRPAAEGMEETNICQRGTMSQRPGGHHTSCRVSSQPEWAMHILCLISQGDGIHYPVGHPLLGEGIPLSAGLCDRQRASLRS